MLKLKIIDSGHKKDIEFLKIIFINFEII
jgi:hypothetical protein